jgi:hypothetical protein
MIPTTLQEVSILQSPQNRQTHSMPWPHIRGGGMRGSSPCPDQRFPETTNEAAASKQARLFPKCLLARWPAIHRACLLPQFFLQATLLSSNPLSFLGSIASTSKLHAGMHVYASLPQRPCMPAMCLHLQACNGQDMVS